MSTNKSAIDSLKKPVAHNGIDWHPAQIIAEIKKLGTSLQREARLRHYYRTTLNGALGHPYPKAERIIAEIIGVSPQEIWPSRYHADGTPKSGRGERNKFKDSTGNQPVNVQDRKAA